MASGSGIEPEIGKKYRYSYIGGRVYDPDRMEEEGIFVHKLTTASNNKGNTSDFYIFVERLPGFRGRPQMYYLRYISKSDIQAERGAMNAGFPLDDFVNMINSRDFVHPPLDGFMTPYKLIDVNEIAEILKREKARGNIGSFMTNVIYHGPIRKTTNTGEETTVFTGGPMYKRGLASFTSASGTANKRKSRKQRGGQSLGQPLKYTDASYIEPSAGAGFNRQGIEPPYLIRPALNAIPMRGGADQILNPMDFKDAYHSAPLAPTGQALTDLKLPATLRQGLNFGRLSGGGRRNTRRNIRRGGFYPSIMGGVVSNATLLAPLAARQGVLLLEKYRGTSRRRRSTRKSSRRRNSGRRA